jgi:hypothetical protein
MKIQNSIDIVTGALCVMRYALCRINFDNWGCQNPTTFFSGGCSGAESGGGIFSKTTVVIFWVDKL